VIPLSFLGDSVTVRVGDSVTIPRAILAVSEANCYIISQAKVFLEVRRKFDCFGLRSFNRKLVTSPVR